MLLPFTMALSFDTVYIFGFDIYLFTFRLIGLFTAFSTFDMDQLGKIRVNTTGKSALILVELPDLDIAPLRKGAKISDVDMFHHTNAWKISRL